MVPGLKILNASQAALCDEYTRQHEPISESDLMERASVRVAQQMVKDWGENASFHVVCGPGNNGGDGLCIAAFLAERKIQVRCSVFQGNKTLSAEMQLRLKLPEILNNCRITLCTSPTELHFLPGEIVVDALFGTGLRSQLTDFWAKITHQINQSGNRVVSVDIPSGLFTDAPQKQAPFVKANQTYTIQTPKISFFYPENQIQFSVIDAGINTGVVGTDYFYLDPGQPSVKNAVQQWLPHRSRFGHKGTFGHTLLIGGNEGMGGAIALAANACTHAGCGLTTVWAPQAAQFYLGQQPSVMHKIAPLQLPIPTELNLNRFSAIAIGPGLGVSHSATALLHELLINAQQPLILDADALNIIAQNKQWLKLIPKGSIITPHPKEFERLFGQVENGYHKLSLLKQLASELGIYILAKDTYSALCTPKGQIIFNGTGNHKLARGGSGDKLTGTIVSLFAQNKDMMKAATCAMYYCGQGGLFI
jgi:NAD(P)H-hydrate epimerase